MKSVGPDPCDCRGAVLRAYDDLIACGLDQQRALTAATRVYRYHHPEQAAVIASTTVAAWVARGYLH